MEYLARSLLIWVGILTVLSNVEAKSVASRFTICKVKDKNFQECFRASAEKALQGLLADGIPELGFPSLDPLFVPQLVISTGDGPVGLTLKFDNTSHTGIRNAKIVSAKADAKNHKFEFTLKIPSYTVTGPYEASGRILLLPITGKGLSNFTYHDVDVNWVMEGKGKTDTHGKNYMDVEKFDVKIHSDHASIMMSNLFNGDKALSDMMHKFLNEHQKDFIGEIEPSLNEAFSKLYLGLSKHLFKKLPYDEVFPDLKE